MKRIIRGGISATKYTRIHKWLKKRYGNARKCQSRKCPKETWRFEWAKIKGKKYDKKRSNFKQLCRDCHIKYDYMKKNEYVRLNSWVTKVQKTFLEKESKKTGKSEAELVREAIYKFLGIK